MKSLKLLLLVGIGSLASYGEAGAAESNKAETVIGRRVPDIVLPDATGKQIALSDFSEAKTLVVVFLGTQCPIGNSYVSLLGDLQERYQEQSVQVIGIN